MSLPLPVASIDGQNIFIKTFFFNERRWYVEQKNSWENSFLMTSSDYQNLQKENTVIWTPVMSWGINGISCFTCAKLKWSPQWTSERKNPGQAQWLGPGEFLYFCQMGALNGDCPLALECPIWQISFSHWFSPGFLSHTFLPHRSL